MHILSFKNNNIIAIPKCGCTTIIKLCTDIEKFKNHNHSYSHNNCSFHRKIHSCSNKTFGKINKKHPTIIIYRYPHERFISFYVGNNYTIPKGMSFEDFVNTSLKNINNIKGFKHHCSPIHILLQQKGLNDFKNYKFIHLSQLNDFWLKTFNIDISNHKVNNRTNSSSLNFDNELLNKIKNHKDYKDEYLFLDGHK